MNKEEILSAAREQNKGMDERVHRYYQAAYMIGAAASICIAAVFMITEAIREGNWFGYTAIVMAQLSVSSLVFGIKARDTSLGKFYLASGIICSISFLFNFVLYFYRLSL